jgi:hypothetical protein
MTSGGEYCRYCPVCRLNATAMGMADTMALLMLFYSLFLLT